LEKKDKNISKIYSKTYQMHSEIIADYERLYTALATKYEVTRQEKQSLTKDVADLKTSLEKANIEKAAVLDIGENIEKQMQTKLAEADRIQKDHKQQIEELSLRVKELEEENSTLFEKVIKHAKERTDKILDTSPVKAEPSEKSAEEAKAERAVEKEEAVDKKDAFTFLNIGAAKKNEIVGETNVRIMTLKQLKEIISEIYENKEKHDEKCKRTRLPLETMEQFMFTYLNQKYGLKNLIIEWAASIVNGVKCYMKEDSDVALFAKILKNEIEEDFRYIQNKIKVTVSKVLKRHLREKYKHKSEQELNILQENLEQGFISHQALNYILDYIYEQSDKLRIVGMIEERKKYSLKEDNLYSNRGRNVTPPKYTNAKTNYTASPISYRTKDLTPRNRSKSGLKILGDD
jgi:hypothetical protein